MKNNYFVFMTIVLFLFGCNKKNTTYDQHFILPIGNIKNITADSIAVEIINISEINTSFIGYCGLVDNRIYFTDKISSFVYVFDENLRLISKKLGRGRARNEIIIRNLAGYYASSNGNHYFVGHTRDIYIYDSLFNLVSEVAFFSKEKKYRLSKKIYEREDFYSLAYNNMIIREFDNELFFNVAGGNNDYNISTPKFYTNARNMMSVDAKNGDINKLFGRLSPNVKFMSAFWGHQYDIDKAGNFYLSHECDSLIYVYNKDFEEVYSFGYSGLNMNQDYEKLTVGRAYAKEWKMEQSEKGYYNSICKVEDYLFRTYKTGNCNYDRMQIYHNNILTADVSVPSGFKVLGYIAPYYYSHFVTNEEETQMTIYRFKI